MKSLFRSKSIDVDLYARLSKQAMPADVWYQAHIRCPACRKPSYQYTVRKVEQLTRGTKPRVRIYFLHSHRPERPETEACTLNTVEEGYFERVILPGRIASEWTDAYDVI